MDLYWRETMKALVTGATGFIGSNIVRALLDRGYKVRAFVRQDSDRRNLRKLDVELAIGDIRDHDALKKAISGCKIVFHAAALYSFWTQPRSLIYDVNVGGTRNALEACLQMGVERVIYTSSVAALALPKDDNPVDESTPVDPRQIIGDYKKSKYLAEQVALEFSRKMPVVIVNPSFPVGPGDIKPTPTGQVILDFLKRKMPAYVKTGMNVVDVEDVALGHILALDKGRVGERYILGNKNMTMGELLNLLEQITGLPSPKIKLPYYPLLGLSYLNAFMCKMMRTTPRMTPETIRMSGHCMYFDPSKAISELGLPQSPPKQALYKAVKWFRENGYVN
jgi:dihydroflavonol-4-reductase